MILLEGLADGLVDNPGLYKRFCLFREITMDLATGAQNTAKKGTSRKADLLMVKHQYFLPEQDSSLFLSL